MAEQYISVKPMSQEQQKAVRMLKKHNRKLDRQEYRTLWGQILEGKPEAAIQGLTTILKRDLEKNYWEKHKRII